jgi:hypothetical protein
LWPLRGGDLVGLGFLGLPLFFIIHSLDLVADLALQPYQT